MSLDYADCIDSLSAIKNCSAELELAADAASKFYVFDLRTRQGVQLIDYRLIEKNLRPEIDYVRAIYFYRHDELFKRGTCVIRALK